MAIRFSSRKSFILESLSEQDYFILLGKWNSERPANEVIHHQILPKQRKLKIPSGRQHRKVMPSINFGSIPRWILYVLKMAVRYVAETKPYE
ncbi:hypothetical protein E4T56_gene2224 [Termitomyces sp. T112]|nr:hypothetical protein E4T56_gene2224 [Termitomyces sp. T112]